MSRAGVSMSLRTRGSGPPGAKMGAKLKAPLEELDWDRPGKFDLKSHNILADTASKLPELDPTCWRSLGDARTLEEQMGIIRQVRQRAACNVLYPYYISLQPPNSHPFLGPVGEFPASCPPGRVRGMVLRASSQVFC